MIKAFWKRRTCKYFHHLQNRATWDKETPKKKLRQIVFIKVKETPLAKWPLAHINFDDAGSDGKTRALTIRYHRSQEKHALRIVNLCPFSLQLPEESARSNLPEVNKDSGKT